MVNHYYEWKCLFAKNYYYDYHFNDNDLKMLNYYASKVCTLSPGVYGYWFSSVKYILMGFENNQIKKILHNGYLSKKSWYNVKKEILTLVGQSNIIDNINFILNRELKIEHDIICNGNFKDAKLMIIDIIV